MLAQNYDSLQTKIINQLVAIKNKPIPDDACHVMMTTIDYDDIENLLKLPLGAIDHQIYNNSFIKQMCAEILQQGYGFSIYLRLNLRLALDRYLASVKSDADLKEAETAILCFFPSSESVVTTLKTQDKAAGTYISPIEHDLIRQIWLTKDQNLIGLFQKHFGSSCTPPSQLFTSAGIPVPEAIADREKSMTQILARVDPSSLPDIEAGLVIIQRAVREKQRDSEEIRRIALRDAFYLKKHHMTPQQLREDASTPYKPRCEEDLSERIMRIAAKVSAFSTVKHITHANALQSILDDAFFGQRTLKDRNLPFTPAALKTCDILNGDADVICLGPQDIDPEATGEIIIEFDLQQLMHTSSLAFYKQRDLEYQTTQKFRIVNLGSIKLAFDHTGPVRLGEDFPATAFLQIRSYGALYRAGIPKSSLISYNLDKMHMICTLNFFRFIDCLDNKYYAKQFYDEVARLNDEELMQFLTDLEKNMTDTAEFNFYGAHQVQFSTIVNITTCRGEDYTLNLPNFIRALIANDINALRIARNNIPELFQSYRFLDYLLKMVDRQSRKGVDEVVYYLDGLRKQCKTPDWMPAYKPKTLPEGFKPCWDGNAEVDTTCIPSQIPILKTQTPAPVLPAAEHTLGNQLLSTESSAVVGVTSLVSDTTTTVSELSIQKSVTQTPAPAPVLPAAEHTLENQLFSTGSSTKADITPALTSCYLTDIPAAFSDRRVSETFSRRSNTTALSIFIIAASILLGAAVAGATFGFGSPLSMALIAGGVIAGGTLIGAFGYAGVLAVIKKAFFSRSGTKDCVSRKPPVDCPSTLQPTTTPSKADHVVSTDTDNRTSFSRQQSTTTSSKADHMAPTVSIKSFVF